MEGNLITTDKKLLPLSWIYGLGVGLRNLMFEMGLLKSRSYKVPIISVGNITVGGTGKTPHVEYLIRLFQGKARTAVLSRGYKRKSRGFVLADANTTVEQIGDEPYQMKQKFPEVEVAVDKKRTRGIETLTGSQPTADIDVILLDDAFQHRYVKPGINILLVDYHRLIIYDRLLPAGRLREHKSGKNRADIVIVTKCPTDLKPMDYRVITKAMNLFPYQQLYFTTMTYLKPKAVFDEAVATPADLQSLRHYNTLLLTGIASPAQMMLDLKEHIENITPLTFADHHAFRKRDVRRINEAFNALEEPRCIVTTEKDAVRLRQTEGLSDNVKKSLYALPIEVSFMQDQQELFNENILGYVRKNSRNSILAKRKDEVKPQDGNRPGDRPRTISFRNY